MYWRNGLVGLLGLVIFIDYASASLGDRLPDFKDCVHLCRQENCVSGGNNLRKRDTTREVYETYA